MNDSRSRPTARLRRGEPLGESQTTWGRNQLTGKRIQLRASQLQQPRSAGAARPQPLAVGAADAARLAGISRSHWFRLVASGRAPAGLRLGSRRLWRVDEIDRWLAAGAPAGERWETMQREGTR